MLHNDVAVVVAAWDRHAELFLDEALAGVLAEPETVELVLVDNASRTPVPVPDDPRVRVIRSSRRLSCGGARNLGLEHVTSPYVVMWDADDVVLPGTFRHLRDGFESDTATIAQAAAIYESPDQRHRWPPAQLARLTARPRLLATVNSVLSIYPTTGATMLRTEVVREAGLYGDVDVFDDWALGSALLWRGRVGWSERPGRVYRQHDDGTLRRHDSPRHVLGRARRVRARLAADHGVPSVLRRSMPVLALVHWAVIFGVRPLRARWTGG